MRIRICFVTSIFLLLVWGCNTKSKQKSATTDSLAYELVWSDEFDYSGLPDSTKWKYDTEGNKEGWGNNESQHYTIGRKENAWVEDGTLKITAHKESFEGKEYTSARLNSKADWKYGKIEVRAKLPDGKGSWPAIWMMPGGWTFKDGNWPDIGEIDIMEHVGHKIGEVHASTHSKDYQWQKGTQKTATVQVENATKEFHTYTLEWTPKVMKCYVDDQQYFEYQNEGLGESKWPYDKAFYLILNVAVGGEWGNVEGIDNEAFPQSLEIDFVRVYQEK
jgi:beta-glucanase (GH16 family)